MTRHPSLGNTNCCRTAAPALLYMPDQLMSLCAASACTHLLPSQPAYVPTQRKAAGHVPLQAPAQALTAVPQALADGVLVQVILQPSQSWYSVHSLGGCTGSGRLLNTTMPLATQCWHRFDAVLANLVHGMLVHHAPGTLPAPPSPAVTDRPGSSADGMLHAAHRHQ